MKSGILFLHSKPQGFGMIAADDGGQVFLLHSDLPKGFFDTLNQGDRLEFDTIQDAKGLRAINVTRVRHLDEQITITETNQVPGAGGAFRIKISKKKPKPAKKSSKKRKK